MTTPATVPGGRSFAVGVPAEVTVRDDGTVTITVYLGEVAEGAADEGASVLDTNNIATAVQIGTAVVTTSKGA